jgi:hypothetical protein
MSASIGTYGTLVQWIVSERRAGEAPNLPTTIPTQSDTSIKT